MSRPVPPLNLRAESLGSDAPEWAIAMFEQVNAWAQAVTESLGSIPISEQKEGILFTTDTLGSAYVDVKNPLPFKPTALALDKLNAADGTPISNVYSWSWQFTSDVIRVLFIGLAASTRYRMTVTAK